MKPIRTHFKQPRSEEVRDTILNFIRRKFYDGHYVDFAKQKKHLLKWVVFELAVYLDSKAVTIPASRYIEIMTGEKGILMEALRFGDTGNITYLPAWLRKCVQSHLAIHGEDYYNEGKSVRNSLDAAIKFAEMRVVQEPNPVRELAAAFRLLKTKKRALKPSKTDQPTLF